MISQADIIRTLVNQNCTDESIMSTALSPDCTLPKLLEKFTEAERFDLALDISMKLGLDVLPIWKTWAMRCLKNRNFPVARDKFKHCFQQTRISVQCNLLNDILNVLKTMHETKLPLSEEVELIKQRAYKIHSTSDSKCSLQLKLKPKIFAECQHYLREFGSIEDEIKFYVDTESWDYAIKLLLEHASSKKLVKFFVNEVFLHSASRGQLDKVIKSFLELDPNFIESYTFLQEMYNYYTINEYHNSLYYVQSALGDWIAAAESQVSLFLRPSVTSYKEFNRRLNNLQKASSHYKQYLANLSNMSNSNQQINLFKQISKEETHSRVSIIDTQIDITRNFAINEVTGCIKSSFYDEPSNSTLDDDFCDTKPVTLFDQSERKKLSLVALIMIYYDPSCKSYFSDGGFQMARRLMNEMKLDRIRVFKTAVRIIIEDESFDIVETAELLLKRLQEDYIDCMRTKLKSKMRLTNRTNFNNVNDVISRPKATKTNQNSTAQSSTATTCPNQTNKIFNPSYSFEPTDKNVKPGTPQAARLLCDEIMRESIRNCQEPDYKTELAKLLSPEAKIELNIELGKLSIAQRLAFDMKRPDYVTLIMKEADKLNQEHVKDVCQHWLAKH